jgi:hypothetical protein
MEVARQRWMLVPQKEKEHWSARLSKDWYTSGAAAGLRCLGTDERLVG